MNKSIYNPISSEIINALRSICSGELVVTNKENLKQYGKDESRCEAFLPSVVVCPQNSEEVSRIVKLCNQEKIPITPRGGGTGVTGGAVPVCGGLVVSLEKMDKIIEIDEDNLMAVVQPGVLTQTLIDEVAKRGLYYPVDPASSEECTIGGNIAECAGGASAVKYGVTKDYVCGMDIVYANGTYGKLGGKIVKNVSGYNIIQIMLGSEGTLGIICEAVLRLLPMPKYSSSLLVSFRYYEEAAKSVAAIIKKKIVPTAVELMDKKCIDSVEKYTGVHLDRSDAKVYLLIKVDANDITELKRKYELLTVISRKNNALTVKFADSKEEEKKLWDIRRNIRPALKNFFPNKISEDIVVPRSLIPECIKRINELSGKYGIEIFCFGHAGDGNLHVQVLRANVDDIFWRDNIENVISEIFAIAVNLGGSITAEHGIGLTKKKYLGLAIDDASLEIMRNLKKTLDPNEIMNPGKIF